MLFELSLDGDLTFTGSPSLRLPAFGDVDGGALNLTGTGSPSLRPEDTFFAADAGGDASSAGSWRLRTRRCMAAAAALSLIPGIANRTRSSRVPRL